MTSADHIEEGLDGDISDEELEDHFAMAQYEYDREDRDDMEAVREALAESDERVVYESLVNVPPQHDMEDFGAPQRAAYVKELYSAYANRFHSAALVGILEEE